MLKCLLFTLFMVGALAQCVSDADCGDSSGLCSSGTCQCAVGYAGDLIDPAGCSLVCTPAGIPDSVEFLSSPVLDVSAQSGQFVLTAVLDSYLDSVPTTVALLHPETGSRCGVLPDLLGSGALQQAVNNAAGECDSNITYRSAFASQVAQPCWRTTADQVESGPQYAVTFQSYETIVEVVQQALAPFGQVASKQRQQSSTLITERFRRSYTINVATSFRPNSAPFTVTADGRVRYRLVQIDYDLLGGEIRVVVETQVQVEARLAAAALSTEASSGLASLDTISTGDCEASSPAGFCNQFITLAFATDPCAVSDASLALNVQFQCADGVTAPADCGFPGLLDATFLLDNMPITYDSCAQVVTYGIDAANSFLRLHDDVARTNVLSAPVTQDDTYFGRCSVVPSGDARFQSVTLQAMSVWRVDSPANVDLGDQLPSAFVTLLSAQENVNPANAVWDFELLIDPAFFSLLDVYYLEAELLLTFANTGPLTRKIRMPIEPGSLVSHAAKRQSSDDASQDGVSSPTFRLQAKEEISDDDSIAPATGPPLGIIIGAAVGGCIVVAAILVAVIVTKKRKRSKEEKSEKGVIEV